MSHFHICILYAIFTLFLNLDLLLFFGVFFVCQQLHITLAILFIVNRTCIYKYTYWICHIIMDLYIPGSILHVHKHTLLFIIHVLTFFYSALSILWTSLSVTSCPSSCQPIRRQDTTVVYVSPSHSTCWTTYKRRVMIRHIPHQSYRS